MLGGAINQKEAQKKIKNIKSDVKSDVIPRLWLKF
jgi:hypothetical protein